ncbi:Catechol 2,3-dioxygenase [Quadrisphaera granulorum]|uniref:Catechol 2,3-dioxygenase-like lactoylglutathione lyase family enzyme n=1 Tax=Quadrisphaera granulorum TaxID=317664 RepID=A0A316A7S6_9ACTN|nr:catechol 2,3-dioxygenase-like lactoylglutathione lyase family enzyme [Quadrisphaera granulorum]SZE96952.1 Catechol 2,3-dioxygenase [Quadrisphaera granulorum]
MPSIPLFKVLVHDLDEAVDFYTGKLGMDVIEDERLGDYRWVLVGYSQQPGFGINLDLATSNVEKDLVGRQAAGLPLFSIATDDCRRDHEVMTAKGVKFEGPPESQPWGTAVTLHDVSGNRIHLSQDA